MIIQIINLSSNDIFKKYSSIYKIYREVYQPHLIALELRDMPAKIAGSVQKIVLGENEICYKSNDENNKTTNLFIPGSLWNIKEISRKILSIGDEDLGYKITNVIKNFEGYYSKVYKIGSREFKFGSSYVMGILNVTPDSFSDGGLYFNTSDAAKHGIEMIDEGADIIDVGGESTRPGSVTVNESEELERVIPVINKILLSRPDAIISIDTTKKNVAGEALKAGAKIVNDISSLTYEPGIADVVKKYNASLILMHMKGTPKDMQKNPYYDDVVNEIYNYFYYKTADAVKYGIKNIFVDPGIGFGKRTEDNYELIQRLEDFKSLGFPVVIGVSRKSFIGKYLNLDVTDRDAATVSVESIAIKNGARIIRTHNVKYGVQVCKLLNILC